MIHLMILGGFLIHLGFSLKAGLLSYTSLTFGTLFLIGPPCLGALVHIELSFKECTLQKIITAFKETKRLRQILRRKI